MADRLNIQIGLSGVAEVQRQLADVSEAGQKAFNDISNAAEQVGGFDKLKPEEIAKRLADAGNLTVDEIKKIQDAINTLSFEDTTKSIAQLGTTSQQAFEAAAAAAQKFGASQTDLQKVEGIIGGLAARARDTHISFQELAQNYDRARSAAGG